MVEMVVVVKSQRYRCEKCSVASHIGNYAQYLWYHCDFTVSTITIHVCRTGVLQVLEVLHTCCGIMVQKICTVLALKEW